MVKKGSNAEHASRQTLAVKWHIEMRLGVLVDSSTAYLRTYPTGIVVARTTNFRK
jgi:hypothetical protein